jgi:hypothetical protein
MSICNQTTLQMKFTKRQRERFWIYKGELIKLVSAIRYNYLDSVKLLLQEGAVVTVESIRLAIRMGHLKIALELIRAGKDLPLGIDEVACLVHHQNDPDAPLVLRALLEFGITYPHEWTHFLNDQCKKIMEEYHRREKDD